MDDCECEVCHAKLDVIYVMVRLAASKRYYCPLHGAAEALKAVPLQWERRT